ncbi:TetR family transcriptional regulator [Novacetimonas cocois]|uniref:TetR family transcriptional regulator n=1 Tax=Novacetimonas cocois TaxID=1747507 RepID=A0A365YXJ4_9PROT|nr:TetR family transcriptional regulator [Novacetimonas cocois]RBM08024.1 TetR family transcriptional regulator [Novacetimonas cocois]
MDNDQFDDALLRSAMERAALYGWRRLTVVDAARDAGLSLDVARKRFPFKASILLTLGRLADEAALVDDGSTGTPREKLFDLLMRRLDVFQQYRAGVRAALRALPFDPPLALLLGGATMESMKWMLGAAGLDISGVAGALRVQALLGAWTVTLRAWDKDDSLDMGTTMAALDKALDKALRFSALPGIGKAAAASGETQAPAGHDFSTDPSVDLPLEPLA